MAYVLIVRAQEFPSTMTFDGVWANGFSLPFDSWKLHLRKDCELQDKLPAFNALGDDVLRLLWETGIEPSVIGIVNHSAKSGSPD